MPFTTNIPAKARIPLKGLWKSDYDQIVAWMKTRPHNDQDDCVHRQSRWTFMATDAGVATEFSVRDNLDGTVFMVPVDITTL